MRGEQLLKKMEWERNVYRQKKREGYGTEEKLEN